MYFKMFFRAVVCGEEVSLLTEDRLARLDLISSVQPTNTAWSAKLRFQRIDGENSGQVCFT